MRHLARTILVIMLVQIFATLPVFALSSSDYAKLGIDHFDEVDTTCTNNGSTNNAQNKKVMVIGDSLTVGMDDAGLLLKIKSAGFDIDPAYESLKDGSVTRHKGKSVEATVGYRVSNTLERLKTLNDTDSNLSSADIIIIGLGTNPETNLTTSIGNLVQYLRQKNTKLVTPTSILWVNTNYTSTSIRPSSQANTEIATAATTNNFTVIDIASDADLKPDSSDGFHYSATKYGTRADYIVSELKGKLNINSNAYSVGTLSAEDNHKFAWDFFVNKKGLSPNAAAGLMGNLEAESGINPQNMQNGAPLPDGPEMPSVVNAATGALEADPAIRGRWGYGIAQWTTASRQDGLLNAARTQGRSSGSIDFQLDYLWTELESRWFSDVLTVLKKTDVTLEEASDIVLLEFESPASVIFQEEKETYDQHLLSKENATNARRAKSIDMFSKYSGSTYTGSNLSGCSNGTPFGGSGNGSLRGVIGGDGFVDGETGYAFPMEPQKQTKIGGISINQALPTHAPGPAYDLFGPGHIGNQGGDDVYAIDDGVIYSVGEDEPGWCYNIQLKADDGYYYWYGHLNNIVVRQGQRVKSGQVMGETAQWTSEHTCKGSSGATHLHIDRGCTTIENGVSVRHTGGRPECRDLEFIPLLSQIYGRLTK